jgi:hypothetical protein
VIFENGIGVTLGRDGGTVPYSEGFGVVVGCTTAEALEERVGAHVGVHDGKNPDEIFWIGFTAKTKRITLIPNNINPLNRNRENFILSSSHPYLRIIYLPFVSPTPDLLFAGDPEKDHD